TVLKLNPNGAQQWVRSYYGPNPYGTGSNYVQGLAIDPLANVLVTGSSPGPGTTIECGTVKFDASGNQLWARRYNPAPNGATFASSLRVDSYGRVYVAGSCRDTNQVWNYVVAKYSPAGKMVGEASYEAGRAGESLTTGLVVDDQGRGVVTGYVPARSGFGQEFATIAYPRPLGTVGFQTNGHPTVVFPGLPGSTYRVLCSTNFLDWADMGPSVANADAECVYEDAESPPAAMRFYRIIKP
ncbi:MAG TPA: hypothetical protein VNT26_24200, partial [Candidatus Sulfotelmatobacter sp.]|nr:hypothetical protein [Candidatus Sulfotelmatobacter sp.]